LGEACRAAIARHDGPVERWLHALDPVWNLVGRVCFHLAENRADAAHPFAFLATYTVRAATKAVHVPLSRALTDSSDRRDKSAMLDFSVDVTLDGQRLTPAELRALMKSADGLVPIRGRWVELDRERLQLVLAHWRAVERAAGSDGMSFLDGMRLLAGARIGQDD